MERLWMYIVSLLYRLYFKVSFQSSFLQHEQEREREKQRQNQFPLFWFERERNDTFQTYHYFNNKTFLWSLYQNMFISISS